jgi:hypothetical protein
MIDETDKRDNAAPERDNASERPGERHDRDSGPRESLRQNLEDAWRAHGGELPEKDDDRRRSAEPRNRPARQAKAAAQGYLDTAKAQEEAGTGDYISGIIKGVAGIGSIALAPFTGGASLAVGAAAAAA